MSAKPIHGAPMPRDVPPDMRDTSPRPFLYSVGQVVCYTNGNGISATARIRGFSKEPHGDRFVYLEHWSGTGWRVGAWWFAEKADAISPERNFSQEVSA